MRPELLLARAAGKISSLDNLGAGFGAMKPEDVGAALAGFSVRDGKRRKLDRGSELIGLAIWAKDGRARVQFEVYLAEKGRLMARVGGWKSDDMEYLLMRFSRLVMTELECRVCQKCGGREDIETGLTYILVDGRAEQCPSCGGGGKMRLTGVDRAASLGIKDWQTWGGRYEKMFLLGHNWLVQAYIHIDQRINDGYKSA